MVLRHTLLFVALFISTLSFSQKKMNDALSGFLQTDFMVEYMKLRVEGENAVKNIQSQPGRYSQENLYRLRTEYDKIAGQFNMVLGGIKSDFQDSKKMKYIAKYPESYSDGLQLKLYKLSDEYAKGFQQALADATNNEVDGGAIFFLIAEVIGLTKGLSDYFSKIKREKRLYSHAYLNKYLIAPNRWKTWQEVQYGVKPQKDNFQIEAGFDRSNVQLNMPRNNGGFNNNNNGDFNNDYNNDFNNSQNNNDPFNENNNDPFNQGDQNGQYANDPYSNEDPNQNDPYANDPNNPNNLSKQDPNPNTYENSQPYNETYENQGNSPTTQEQPDSNDIWKYPTPKPQRDTTRTPKG